MFVNILRVCTWYCVHSSLMCSILGVGPPSGPITARWVGEFGRLYILKKCSSVSISREKSSGSIPVSTYKLTAGDDRMAQRHAF